MRFDIDREEFSILSGPCEIGDNESLSAALIALYECHSRWRDVDIEGFFVGVLEIRSVVAEELTGGKSEASCTSDFERGETVDVRRWHRLYVITPTHERRIERAAVVCEVEIFDGGFALEVIVGRDILFALLVGEARADFECHASVGDELQCA
jgi:hypothetical protein